MRQGGKVPFRTESYKRKKYLSSYRTRKSCYKHVSKEKCGIASAAHILKSGGSREDEHGLCVRMTCKFVKRSHFLRSTGWQLQNSHGDEE